MKKGILICLLVIGLGMPTAWAQVTERFGNSRPQSHYTPARQGHLYYKINRLNRTLSQVRSQARARRVNWDVRHRITQASNEVNRINWKYRRGAYNPYRLSREIASAQSRLYVIQRLLNHSYPGRHYYTAR